MLIRFFSSESHRNALKAANGVDAVLSASVGAYSLKLHATQTNFGGCDIVVADMSALRDTDEELAYAVNYIGQVYLELRLILLDRERCAERYPTAMRLVSEGVIRYADSRDALVKHLPGECASLVAEDVVLVEPVKESTTARKTPEQDTAPAAPTFMLNNDRRAGSQRFNNVKPPEAKVEDVNNVPVIIEEPEPPESVSELVSPSPSEPPPTEKTQEPLPEPPIEPMPEQNPVLEPEPISKPEQAPKPEPKRPSHHQPRTIGICGLFHRLGVTTQALGMAAYLHSHGLSVLVVEDNGHGHLEHLQHYYESRVDTDKGVTYVNGIAILDARRSRTIPTGFDVTIYDLGLWNAVEHELFMGFDLPIICVGNKPWEMRMLADIYRTAAKRDFRAHLCFPFVAEGERKGMLELTGALRSRVHFLNDSPSLFTYTPNETVYASLFAAWLQGGDSMRSGAKPANGRIIHMDRTHKKK